MLSYFHGKVEPLIAMQNDYMPHHSQCNSQSINFLFLPLTCKTKILVTKSLYSSQYERAF